MKRLIAERSVLYLGRMSAPGDAPPASDGIMVAAWLRAKSAKWTGEAAEPQQSTQEDAAKTDGSQDSQGQNESQEGKENGQEAKMVEGHLDPDQLSTMKKSSLEKLAEQLGIDISGAKNNKERAELIASATVQVPETETGSAH